MAVLLVGRVFLSLCFFHVVVSRSSPCYSKATCGECIQTPHCFWCFQSSSADPKDGSIHCRQVGDACQQDNVNPRPKVEVTQDNPLTLTKISNNKNAVQLRPQKMTISNMRVGEVINITVQYTQAKDYPVDLYFLMDLSNSMEDDKRNLEKLGYNLADTMRNVTSDFRLGFGSFVEKSTIPFHFAKDSWYPPTYTYKHHMSLDQNADDFVRKVKEAQIIRTRDVPEAGLDALIQAMVCKTVGWREQARRLIVIATDARSHMAGNGKLAGIVVPNDGRCHLSDGREWIYTKALEQDYPSLGQVSKLAKDNHMNLIFAVTGDVYETYKALAVYIQGASTGQLDKDSKNVVQLVKSQYEAISSSLELRDTSREPVKLKYYSACFSQHVQENNQCEGLKVGSVVTFNVSIEVTKCPEDPANRKQTFKIYPVGINEQLTISLEVVCDCPCERPGNNGYKRNAAECHHGGDLKCGVCQCDDEHSGQRCECSAQNALEDLDIQCKPTNSSTKICNGRGDCVCGKCECQRRNNPSEEISGPYCECDNFSCDRIDGELCAGNGNCDCGKCICQNDWTGKACDCRATNETCIPIGGNPLDEGSVCNGNGLCKCGVCQCQPGASGRYCQICANCPSQCQRFEACIQCLLQDLESDTIDESCQSICPSSVKKKDTIEAQFDSKECSYDVDESCKVYFTYSFKENGEPIVQIKKEKECTKPVSVLALGLGLTGAIVVIGIGLLLLWRILTYLYDKREYARFLEETKNTKWGADENPLYVGAQSTFQNPSYSTT